MDYIIIGLGNYEPRYLQNRHNIGWMAAEALLREHKAEIIKDSPVSLISEISLYRKKILVVFPLTYMNGSGEAAKRLLNKHQLAPNRLIALVDEYNFPIGKIHIRKGGSDGGHNGISSIQQELGSADFWRMRLGIDKKFPPGTMSSFVLSDFDAEEIVPRDKMLSDPVLALKHFFKAGEARAASEINSGKIFPESPILPL